MNFSYSRIQSFLQCPLSYRYAYVDKLLPKPNQKIEEGLMAHKILEGLGNGKSKEELISELVKGGADVNTVLKVEDVISKINVDFTHTKYIEHSFSLNYNNHDIWGRIDRVDLNEGWELIDYKYGSWEYDSSPTLQGLIYSLAWMTNFKLNSVRFSYVDVKRNKKTGRLYTENDNFSVIGNFIDEIVKSHSDNNFPAKPSSRCLNCAFNYHCKEWKNWLNDRVKVERPEDVVSNLVRLVERNKLKQKEETKMREFVKEWLDSQSLTTYSYEDWEILNNGDNIIIRRKE